MLRRRLRAALAAAVAAPLLVGPVGADAASAPLSCGQQTGLWQRLPVSFPGVPSVRTRPDPTAYAVDEQQPQRVLVTNGTVVLVDDAHGCDLEPGLVLGAQPTADLPLSGTTSTVVATAFLPRSRALALVREGTGAASRPHVLASPSGERGTWRLSDSGLPAQGNPRLLVAASDGRTAYLVLTPASDAGGSGGPLGALPGAPGTAAPAGLLYATTDSGATWSQRTAVSELPGGATGFDALAVDPGDPDLVYALSGGRLVVSRDGGRTLALADGVEGATAVTTMAAGEVAVLRDRELLHSTDRGTSFRSRPGPGAPRSAAYREGDGFLVVESGERLVRVAARGDGGTFVLDAGVPALPGSTRGDRARDGSFHALAAGFLLRYVDPRSATAPPPPPPVGDVPPPPPPPGTIRPARQSVELPAGTSRIVPLELRLPRSPTPTDVYLLLDASRSMRHEIDQLKSDFGRFVTGVQDGGIALRVGLATIGPGPRAGEAPYPEVQPGDPDYRRPQIYEQHRALGPIDAQLAAALQRMGLQECPPNTCSDSQEGQLLALREMLDGRGIEAEQSTPLVPVYAVAPGQKAGFRGTTGVRKVAVLASDDAFEAPYPTPTGPDGKVAPGFVEQVAGELRDADVSFVGLAATSGGGGGSAAAPDMRRMAELVGTRAPAGGADCGQDIVVPAGAPLVCDGGTDVATVLTRLVRSLADRQSVTLSARGATEVVGSLDASGMTDLDVAEPNVVPFLVRVSCVDLPPGTRTAQVDASLRGFRVATATLDVTCTAPVAAAVVPPRPDPPAVQDPAPPAQPAQAPAVPAPAPPALQAQAQAQVQSQVQAQVQPLTAAALQQQEELALALALLADEKAVPGTELAMVDRRRSEELRALALLSVSMAAASALGLARLRTRRADAIGVRRAR